MSNDGESGLAPGRDPLSDEVIRLCRQFGMEHEPLPEVVEHSWKRCLGDYNLSPDRVPRATVLTQNELHDVCTQSEELLTIAEPEIEKLFLQLVDSEYLVSFASPQGAMLLFRCDYQCIGEMSGFGVLPGSIWSEDLQGTNGVGTAIRLGKSVAIVGTQHYGTAIKPLTCLTTPLFGDQGAVEGVVNVTTGRGGDARINRIVQKIVEDSAKRIETRYFAHVHRHRFQLRFMPNVENMDLSQEGRIALDDDGRIVAATSHMNALIGASLNGFVGAKADDLLEFSTPLRQVRPGVSTGINLRNGPGRAILTSPGAQTGLPTRWQKSAPSPRRTFISVPLKFCKSELETKGLRVDPILAQALDRGQRLLSAGLPLIISGETGCGKTVFAETLAARCFGDDTDLIVIDCAGDLAKQFDAALDASVSHRNACVILDRLDELNQDSQTDVLAFIENARRYWSDKFGLIATAAADPDTMARAGLIRPTLLHRLNGGLISLEPLRSSPELDSAIGDLLKLEQAALGRSGSQLGANARLVLLNYHWPGNLRELRTALRHAVALADGKAIGLSDLPRYIVAQIAQHDLTARSQSEASRIEAALRYNNGNVSLTARYLGVSRATLYRKIEIQKIRADTDERDTAE